MKIYIAGSLFNEAQRIQRMEEGKKIRLVFPKAEVFNPIDFPFNTNKNNIAKAEDIFHKDIELIGDCDVFIGDVSNEDPGVMLALGYAIKTGIKLIIAVNSDSRLALSNQYEIPTVGMNHFVLGAILENGYLVFNFEEAIEKIKEKHPKD